MPENPLPKDPCPDLDDEDMRNHDDEPTKVVITDEDR